MDKFIFFSDFAANHTNRGCQALNYGSFPFMHQVLGIDNVTIISPEYYYRRKRNDEVHLLKLPDETIEIIRRFYWVPEILFTIVLYKLTGGKIGFGRFYKDLTKVDHILNISGGDGFSDIYSSHTFRHLFWPSLLGALLNKKLILLPQTIGPFKKKTNRILANYALRKAEKVFVRDLAFTDQLKKMDFKYELTSDVSFYMKPQEVDINIEKNAVGINVSGLAYYNHFKDLKNRFPFYGELIILVIEFFQKRNVPVFLVPHTYNHEAPEKNADDLQASKDILKTLKNKSGVTVIDADYIAPELKYIISKFDFFIGTRLHSNFAAIFSNVPVFGLAYSYKFSGTFDRYGLKNNYSYVIDMKKETIKEVVRNIEKCYNEREKTKGQMKELLKQL
jgi:polysaccharide pyruvyl transferase WcaK-like protein